MKKFVALPLEFLLAICATLLVLAGCTADYDTFGTSDYHNMNEIAFEEQDGNASMYPSEHKVVVTLAELPDDLEEYDSVTIGSLDISSMATLHLVSSKFKEFPEDSAAIDSLAQEVSYSKDRLREGDKIRIPASATVYVVVVSESGIPDIWQIVFEVPEPKSSSSKKETAKSSSSGKDDGNSSAEEDEPESSSSKKGEASSSSKKGEAPKLLKIQVGAGNVVGSIDQDAGKVFLEMDYATDLDLRNLEVVSLELSEGATANIEEGESYDFSREFKLTLDDGNETREYTVQAGYQYPGSDFDHWVKDAFGNKNDIDGWDNGNNDAISSTKKLTVNENEQVIKMESINATVLGIGRFASGNMFVGYFNPKGVGTLKLTSYDDGNELIDFGRPFYGRPKFVEFDVKYKGENDSCDLYVILENRSRTSNEGKNQYRTSSDVNTMVASAWYRATTVDSKDDPDVVPLLVRSAMATRPYALRSSTGNPWKGRRFSIPACLARASRIRPESITTWCRLIRRTTST